MNNFHKWLLLTFIMAVTTLSTTICEQHNNITQVQLQKHQQQQSQPQKQPQQLKEFISRSNATKLLLLFQAAESVTDEHNATRHVAPEDNVRAPNYIVNNHTVIPTTTVKPTTTTIMAAVKSTASTAPFRPHEPSAEENISIQPIPLNANSSDTMQQQQTQLLQQSGNVLPLAMTHRSSSKNVVNMSLLTANNVRAQPPAEAELMSAQKLQQQRVAKSDAAAAKQPSAIKLSSGEQKEFVAEAAAGLKTELNEKHTLSEEFLAVPRTGNTTLLTALQHSAIKQPKNPHNYSTEVVEATTPAPDRSGVEKLKAIATPATKNIAPGSILSGSEAKLSAANVTTGTFQNESRVAAENETKLTDATAETHIHATLAAVTSTEENEIQPAAPTGNQPIPGLERAEAINSTAGEHAKANHERKRPINQNTAAASTPKQAQNSTATTIDLLLEPSRPATTKPTQRAGKMQIESAVAAEEMPKKSTTNNETLNIKMPHVTTEQSGGVKIATAATTTPAAELYPSTSAATVSTPVQQSSVEWSTLAAISRQNHAGFAGDDALIADSFTTSAAGTSLSQHASSTTTTTTTTKTTIVAPMPHIMRSLYPLLPTSATGYTLASRYGLSSLTASTTAPTTAVWPVKHASVMEGDVILGGLMMVHSREDSITCGPIMPQGGIQALEAMLYTLDQVNKQQLLPNVTLGAHILDDCDKDTYGLEMAVDFIKGSISNIDDAEYHCNKTQVRKVISGVVGAASSVTSIQVANLLRLFRIPQVSFFSTSPELSNKQRFEYFSRTIPSDHYQVKAMVEIVKRMGWSYVSIIYEESNYGIKAYEELEDLLARHNICIATKEKLVKDSGVAAEIAYDYIVQRLLTKPLARGAIIFGSDQEVREVMRAVRRNNATGAFSWIGSDGWSARNLVSDGNEPEVEGTLSVQPQANPVKGFEEYFLNLTVENNQRNPWFVEFWEDHFQCRYPGSLSTPYNNYNRSCTTKERLLRENTDFEDQLQFVSDAVMAFAYALRDMHRDLCGGRPSLCDVMKPTKGADLLKYLRKVQFQGLSGDHFRFDINGDGPARYNIIHFKQSLQGLYHWIKVGEYYEGELRLNMSEVQFKLLHPKPPESVCSLPCERGQAKKYVEGESCCWHCFNCSLYQIRHPNDETQCLTCQLGTLPDASKQFCQTIPEIYLRPESAWAIGAMSFSATGILITMVIVGIFVRHNDTPIVRASGRELSYILLAGILMCYAVTFALVLKPTNTVCAIQRFGVGFCFTVVYAALLTKTNRIARIFKAGKQSAKRPSFISPKSQLVICSFFIFVQILINGVWMVIAPSHAMYHHPTREDNLLVCDSYIDASYMIAFFYPIVLIVVCTVYAVLTRKIPEAFNESKHIGFTMYTTCVIWLAFVPLYFGTANQVPLRITSMSVTISLSASVTIACLFSPKLYIILVRPERNVRQSMMPPRYGNMHRTAGTGPSSMMAAAVVTAATCAQEEKIQKHITPTNTEHSTKAKQLCEMATQTITISSIFTNLDSSTYSQIPYADQYVPSNNYHTPGQGPPPPQQQQHFQQQEQVVVNNNKINQEQHGNPASAATTASTAGPVTTTTTNGAAVAATPLGNHIMLQQHERIKAPTTTATIVAGAGAASTSTTTTTTATATTTL